MADEEKEKVGRIFAYSYVYNGGAVTATKLYFDDGTDMMLKGHLHFPNMLTVHVKYVERPNKPNELQAIELKAGE